MESNLAINRLYKIEFWYLEVQYRFSENIQIEFRCEFQQPIEVETAP